MASGPRTELPNGSNDASGTVVLADKPAAVLAGNRFYRFQPQPEPGSESTHQQVPPVSALGSAYLAAPYATRRADLAPETIHYRLVGAFDGTALVFDPPVAGAPTAVGEGEVVDFVSAEPFLVTSQDADHPFLMAQIMDSAYFIGVGQLRPGAVAPGWDQMLGDEEFVVMLPPAQFLQHYVFFTDPSYPTTNLVVTRARGASGFADVTLDCIGTVGGWQPVGASGLYQVTSVDLVRANVPVGSCTNGRHTAESDAPFGVVVWGLDSYSSYAYPAGGNAAQLTDAVVQPIPH
ncbi:MAG: IgGFc-binding protein [Polyangiaceae bacterium]|nr:IgGFc-binding protein [Polyangiaceae bacterium]